MRWRSAKLQNIALLVSSFLLAVIALEISLRLAGALFLFTQECRNRVSLHRKDTYRILCLGESTTAGAYPAFLEEALNRRNLGTRFTIIDKGMPAINTSVIVARLGYELNRYHPDMVITMMGINDTGVHMPYEFDSGSGIGRVWKSMRVYKLAKLLWLHTAVKIRQINACRLYRPQACAQALQPVARDEAGYIDLGMRLAQEGKSVEAEAAYKQALQLNPRSDRACFELGRLYRDAGDFLTAEALFKQVLQLNPGHDEACVELGWLYKQEGDISQAESWFNKALHLNHNSDRACFGLGRLYRDWGRFPESEEAFKQAIQRNPHNDIVYIGLARLYIDWDKISEAEAVYKQAIALDSGNEEAFIDLGWLYAYQGKAAEAQEVFRKSLQLNPGQGLVAQALKVLCQGSGDKALARHYAKDTDDAGPGYYLPVTRNNYVRMKDILDQLHVKMVCVQYPLCSIAPLKRVFEGRTGVTFVDNESVFRRALQKGGYKEYFRDMFAGTFGHCTDKGNKLLAENIADVIVKEVFKK